MASNLCLTIHSLDSAHNVKICAVFLFKRRQRTFT